MSIIKKFQREDNTKDKAVIIILTLMMVLGLSTAAYAVPMPPWLGRGRSIEIQPPSGDEEPGDDNGGETDTENKEK